MEECCEEEAMGRGVGCGGGDGGGGSGCLHVRFVCRPKANVN